MAFLLSTSTINSADFELMKNLMSDLIAFDWGLTSILLKIIFFSLVGVLFSAIIFYLWKLVVIIRRLFQLFWASLEDED
ncbi:MAG TPA: hypothetical protein DCE56_40815 [Cyanobacteria bacterium UBA8553]|nr:hypothetical protein [Cyanobacteria bacterium UBA8553]HAJ63412.1 hypothetical protein [Cyanobacteria bacterium UBA8543]